MSTKTMMNIKIDKDLKAEAAKLAELMGFNLSSVVASMLRNFVMSKELTISLTPKMTPYLESAISEALSEKKSDKSPKFNNSKDAIDWLDSK